MEMKNNYFKTVQEVSDFCIKTLEKVGFVVHSGHNLKQFKDYNRIIFATGVDDNSPTYEITIERYNFEDFNEISYGGFVYKFGHDSDIGWFVDEDNFIKILMKLRGIDSKKLMKQLNESAEDNDQFLDDLDIMENDIKIILNKFNFRWVLWNRHIFIDINERKKMCALIINQYDKDKNSRWKFDISVYDVYRSFSKIEHLNGQDVLGFDMEKFFQKRIIGWDGYETNYVSDIIKTLNTEEELISHLVELRNIDMEGVLKTMNESTQEDRERWAKIQKMDLPKVEEEFPESIYDMEKLVDNYFDKLGIKYHKIDRFNNRTEEQEGEHISYDIPSDLAIKLMIYNDVLYDPKRYKAILYVSDGDYFNNPIESPRELIDYFVERNLISTDSWIKQVNESNTHEFSHRYETRIEEVREILTSFFRISASTNWSEMTEGTYIYNYKFDFVINKKDEDGSFWDRYWVSFLTTDNLIQVQWGLNKMDAGISDEKFFSNKKDFIEFLQDESGTRDTKEWMDQVNESESNKFDPLYLNRVKEVTEILDKFDINYQQDGLMSYSPYIYFYKDVEEEDESKTWGGYDTSQDGAIFIDRYTLKYIISIPRHDSEIDIYWKRNKMGASVIDTYITDNKKNFIEFLINNIGIKTIGWMKQVNEVLGKSWFNFGRYEDKSPFGLDTYISGRNIKEVEKIFTDYIEKSNIKYSTNHVRVEGYKTIEIHMQFDNYGSVDLKMVKLRRRSTRVGAFFYKNDGTKEASGEIMTVRDFMKALIKYRGSAITNNVLKQVNESLEDNPEGFKRTTLRNEEDFINYLVKFSGLNKMNYMRGLNERVVDFKTFESMTEEQILKNPKTSYEEKEDQINILHLDQLDYYKKMKARFDSEFTADKELDYPTVKKLVKKNPFLKQYAMLLAKQRNVGVSDLQINQKEEIIENLKRELDGSDREQEQNKRVQIKQHQDEIEELKDKISDNSNIDELMQKWESQIIRITRDLKQGKSVLQSTLEYLR